MGIDELTGNVENFDQFFDALARTSTVPISFEEMDGDTNGFFSLSEKRIAIREGMSEAQTIKTAIHELAHSRLHDFDRTAPIDMEKRKDRNTKEVEAESIAMRDLLAIERQQEQAKMKSQKKEKPVEKGSGKRSSIRKKLERNKAIIAAGSDKNQSTKRDNPQL